MFRFLRAFLALVLMLAGAFAKATERPPLAVEADRILTDPFRLAAIGDVEARQGKRQMAADRIRHDRQTGWLDLFGDVRVREPTYTAHTPRARIGLANDQGWMASPRLHLLASDAWVTADRLERPQSKRLTLTDGCYTACTPPEDPPWQLRSNHIYINQRTDFAHHSNTRFEVGGVPVFYTPYFGHYVDDERHTGFLYPDFETSGERGTDITVPFYWNIAPQLDATLGLRNMTNRGLMPQAEVRHLGPDIRSRVYAEFLGGDKMTGEDRYYAEVEQGGQLPGDLAYSLDAQRVGDPEHLSFFGDGVERGSQRYLTSRLGLGRDLGSDFRWQADFTYLQDLQTFNDPQTLQELPRTTLTGNTPVAADGAAELSLDSEYVHFYRREGRRVHRIFADPQLSYQWQGRYGSLEPKAGVHMTGYRTVPETGSGRTLTRTLPHASLRARSEVARVFQLDGAALRHSVAPELFYLYIPRQDQQALPVLDTGGSLRSFGDLFAMNRFSGVDRINDANQLTTALTSRLQARAGEKRWEAARLEVGQIRYFKDREVRLNKNADPLERSYSNLFAELALRPVPEIELKANAEYDPDRPFGLDRLDTLRADLTVTPGGGYRFDSRYLLRTHAGQKGSITDTEEVRTRATVPLGASWETFGTYRHSLKFGQGLEERIGVAYHAGCWGVRAGYENRLLRRAANATGTDNHDTRIFLTIRFRTLGETQFGTDPTGL